MAKKHFFLIATISIVSILGGIIGGVLVRSYLLNTSFNVPLFGDINVGGRYQEGSLVISQPKNVIVEQDERVVSVIGESRKSTVSWYKKKPAASSPETDGTVLTSRLLAAQYYAPSERIGTGLVLTSDGWVMTATKLADATTIIAVSADGVVVDIERVVYDDISGYTFAKLAANTLVAVRFGERGVLAPGQTIIALEDASAILTTVTDMAGTYTDGTQSSEELYDEFGVAATSLRRGAVMVALDGTVVGLHEATGMVVPMYRYARLLPSVLSDGVIARPFLGVRYLSLDAFVGAQKLSGALVSPDARGISVVGDSPAATIGLVVGDIITAIDGRAIDTMHSLSELIQSRRPGDEVMVRVIRAGETLDQSVVLGTMPY